MKAHQITGDVPWSVQWDKNMMPQHTIVHGPHLMARMGEVAEKDVNRMVQVANILSKVHLVTPFSVIDDGMTYKPNLDSQKENESDQNFSF